MAILMRRGLYKDFDAAKMLPGEWAVSIDSDAQKQVVWMCFSPGIVKRMGTYEDFGYMIEDLTDDIRESYEESFNEIKEAMELLKSETEDYKDIASSKASEAAGSAGAAASSASEAASKAAEAAGSAGAAAGSASEAAGSAAQSGAKADQASESALLAKSYSDGGTGIRDGESTDNSKYYSTQSKSHADTAHEYLGKVEAAGDEAVQKVKDALDMDAPDFQVDLSTGHLMYSGGRFVFNVNDNGHLEWGLAV